MEENKNIVKEYGETRRAVLCGVFPQGSEIAASSSLDELEALLSTAGGEASFRVTQSRDLPDKKTVFGKGKIEELKLLCENEKIDFVIFDAELSPSQIRDIEEALGGLRIIKAFNAEHKIFHKFSKLNEQVRRTFNRMNRKYILAHPVSEFLGTAIIVIVLWFGGSLILEGESTISAPEFIYYLVIFYSIINPIKDLSKASYTIQKGMASLERVDMILQAENPIKQRQEAQSITKFREDIRFEHVSFKYQNDWVLKDINLTIQKGQTVALVGQSGSGKSTMVDLIPRFYDVQEGSIKIDGVDIRDVKIFDLRSLMGIVNQDAILFNDSFFNNITFGVEHPTMEDVVNAAKIANAHDFIMATPDGYDTNIGDRGGKLSGGQRQRISIARAILKNPTILILDEATSALDTESEKLVQEAVNNLMKNRTSIVVAHRLSTITNADIICVLNEGQIVEQGKHNELIALNGYYKRLNDMQQL